MKGHHSSQVNRSRPGKIAEWLCTQTGWMAGALVVIMMAALVREVVGRYFFNQPTDWCVDLNSFLLVAMVYLGTAYTTSIDGHVRADFFYGRIKGRRKAYLDIFIDAVSIFYVSILLWEGWLLAWDSYISGEVSSGGVRWPLFPFQIMVPIGAAFVFLLLLSRVVRNIRFLAGHSKTKFIAPEGK